MDHQNSKKEIVDRKDGGFTLVEMIVSLMIFSIVAVVALAALVKIIDANNKAQTIQTAVTSLSFSLDAMSRELRTGSNIYCGTFNGASFDPTGMVTTAPCPSPSNPSDVIIAFQSATTDNTQTLPSLPCRLVYAYRFKTVNNQVTFSKAEQPKGSGSNPNCSYKLLDADFTPLTPSNMTISSYKLAVNYDQTNQPYPLVFVELSGSAGNKEVTKTYFTVQTAASPRTP